MSRFAYRPRTDPKVRFWNRVSREQDCWIWTGAKDRDGYGLFLIHVNPSPDQIRICMHAHRYAWQLAYGNFSEELLVCHHCDNPSCVRPEHLFLGTAIDNNRDRDTKGRTAKGERHPRFGRKKPFQYRMRLNRPPEPGTRAGEQNGNAKLSAIQVQRIRTDNRAGNVIAAEYSVTPTLISQIRRGLIWKHLLEVSA